MKNTNQSAQEVEQLRRMIWTLAYENNSPEFYKDAIVKLDELLQSKAVFSLEDIDRIIDFGQRWMKGKDQCLEAKREKETLIQSITPAQSKAVFSLEDRIKELENKKQSILESFKGKMEVQSVMHQWYSRKDAHMMQSKIDELKYIQSLTSTPIQTKGRELNDRLFNLANDFAVANQGDIAVLLHSIHNKLD